MKNPVMIRERVLARVVDMLEHLRIQVTMLPDTETDVLMAIQKPAQYDFAVMISVYIMESLGHKTQAKDPRFSRNHRDLKAKKLKGPRGVKYAGDPQPSDGVLNGTETEA
jgi:hypothetical protein